MYHTYSQTVTLTKEIFDVKLDYRISMESIYNSLEIVVISARIKVEMGSLELWTIFDKDYRSLIEIRIISF